MRKICDESAIEIWSNLYLNDEKRRVPEDKNVEIIQVECGSKQGEYIVEFLRLGEKKSKKKTKESSSFSSSDCSGYENAVFNCEVD